MTHLFGLDKKAPSIPHTLEAPGEVAQDVASATVDVAAIVAAGAVGAAIGLAVGIAVLLLLRIALQRHKPGRLLVHRLRIPVPVTFAVIGASLGFGLAESGLDRGEIPWVGAARHAMLLSVIATVTWVVVAAIKVIEDVADSRYEALEAGKARRVTTQMQVLRRVLQVIAVAIGIVVGLLTFPQARAGMTALLSSAGVISIIAGIAAQSVLGNMFAGLQIAFTDSIRVGDVLVYEDKYGDVEEITLTYVVLHIWDDKRLIIPSKQLTENTVQNWTRRSAQVQGTVELPMDWTAPVPALRMELTRLLQGTDLWDGQIASIQTTDSKAGELMVRVVVSAATPSDLWDLRCYLREHLVDWTVRNAPYALTRTRLQPEHLKVVKRHESDDEIARLAEELVTISGGVDLAGGGDDSPETTAELLARAKEQGNADPFVLARLKAAHRKAKRHRRKSEKQRRRLERVEAALAEVGLNKPLDNDQTAVLSAADVEKLRNLTLRAVGEGNPTRTDSHPDDDPAKAQKQTRGKEK